MQELKKEICSLNTIAQELKIKKFSLEKIKDDSNAVHFYTGFENFDALITVFKCLELKATRTSCNCKDRNNCLLDNRCKIPQFIFRTVISNNFDNESKYY